MKHILFILAFVVSLWADDLSPYEEARERLIRSNYTYEGTRTKTYDSTKTIEFEIYCSKWFETKYASDIIDSLKRCSFEWHLITIDRYESGRLVSTEDWCDTVKKDGDPLCLSLLEKRTFSIKPDSLGLFLRNQTRYVWNEKGRLKQRILWELGNPYGLNGTYEFIYKSPCDPVRVIPEDREWGWDAMQKGRYDGSFGKIPEMGDPEYASFAKNPYPSLVLDGPDLTPFNSDESQKAILERQMKRCEDYKKSLNKNHPVIETE